MAYIAKLSNSGGVKSLNRYVSALAGNAAFVPSSYESIATVTVGSGGASQINFTSIPQTYAHLQLRLIARGTTAGSYDWVYFSFNSGTGNDISRHHLFGNGSSVTSYGQASTNGAWTVQAPFASGAANVFGSGVVDILDYTNANKKTTVRSIGGYDANGTSNIAITSSSYQISGAITSLSFGYPAFAQYSQIALYGIKGA